MSDLAFVDTEIKRLLNRMVAIEAALPKATAAETDRLLQEKIVNQQGLNQLYALLQTKISRGSVDVNPVPLVSGPSKTKGDKSSANPNVPLPKSSQASNEAPAASSGDSEKKSNRQIRREKKERREAKEEAAAATNGAASKAPAANDGKKEDKKASSPMIPQPKSKAAKDTNGAAAEKQNSEEDTEEGKSIGRRARKRLAKERAEADAANGTPKPEEEKPAAKADKPKKSGDSTPKEDVATADL